MIIHGEEGGTDLLSAAEVSGVPAGETSQSASHRLRCGRIPRTGWKGWEEGSSVRMCLWACAWVHVLQTEAGALDACSYHSPHPHGLFKVSVSESRLCSVEKTLRQAQDHY